ncbi:RNA polymerase sigma-70 factor [Pseudoclavibacter endophyticus]|uniref:RNA polymerase sigma-70 factor n=2 Tax=Pseudoclavibacter endophyticus TaxID=1778590 RepID=A0A6H9WU98_9MICO|nr:RNA polymerase sigma-70 factor [Pseudoclavibacter endophyticus]
MLFSIAYRMLGSVSDAEDAVQEAWPRFQDADPAPRSPRAFLTTVVSRLCIDVLRSARKRREHYVGDWLPEPLIADPYDDPAHAAELADSMTMAALVLLERLSPLERAVFVLRDVFGHEYAEIAGIMGRSEPACRQVAARARRHMGEGRARFNANRAAGAELADRFFGAFREGDLASLTELLAADATLTSDSGGKAPSLPRRIIGADKIARLLASLSAPSAAVGMGMQRREINGAPGALMTDSAGRVLNTIVLEIADGTVQVIRIVVNPDKLAHLGPVADAWRVHEDVAKARRLAGRGTGPLAAWP